MPKASVGGSAARGSAVTLLNQAARALIQFGLTIALTRLLSPEAFGVVAMVVAVTGVAEILRDFGLSSAVLRAPTLSIEQRTNLFWLNTGIGAVAALVIAIAAPLLSIVYSNDLVLPVTIALAFAFVANGAATQYLAGLARDLKFTRLAIVELSALVISAGIAVTAAIAGLGVWSLVFQQLSLAFLTWIFAWIAAGWTPGLPCRTGDVRDFVRFGRNLMVTRILAHAANNSDSFVLGVRFDAGVVGVYNRAYQLLSVPLNQINAPLTRVALPVLSKVFDDRERYVSYLRRAQLMSCYVTAPIMLALAGGSESVVSILFGSEWLAAAPILSVLCIAGVFRAISQVSFWMYLSADRTGSQFRMYLVTQPIVVALVILGSLWGPIGVATGYSVGMAIFWIVGLLHASHTLEVPAWPFFRTSIRAIVAVAVPIGIIFRLADLWSPIDLASLLVGGMASAVWIAALLLVPPLRRDFSILAQFVKRAIVR